MAEFVSILDRSAVRPPLLPGGPAHGERFSVLAGEKSPGEARALLEVSVKEVIILLQLHSGRFVVPGVLRRLVAVQGRRVLKG
ncbi:hypothetical protein EYF80_054379 [Liparis tanakae]|uniref:Uncharacterized protein n=1 Tax=Liparis tanakae TaxID=230148 RepID=A0A4Z2F3H8_9TELE|nr:hypothetical protein EYF80_054379 [Liparis tanakae]